MTGSKLREFYKDSDMFFHRNVMDIDTMKAFYEEYLDLKLIAENPDYKWCSFELPVFGITLSLSEDHSRANTKQSVDGLEISVTDLEKVKSLLEQSGVKCSEIVDLAGILSMFDIHDPEQNLVTFIGSPRVS